MEHTVDEPSVTRSLDVGRAIAHVRQGRPVVIGADGDAVLTLPATVLNDTALDILAGHGGLTIVVRRRLARRLELPEVVAVNDHRIQRDLLSVASALSRPNAVPACFTPDARGVPVRVVPDDGAVDDDLTVLATELAELAGFVAVAVVVPVARPVPGPVVRAEDLLVAAVEKREPLDLMGVARLPVEGGELWAHAVRMWDGAEHLVLTPGPELGPGTVHVRAACLVGHVFATASCGCRRAYDDAVRTVLTSGSGCIVYLRSPTSRVPCDVERAGRTAAVERVLVEQLLAVAGGARLGGGSEPLVADRNA